MGGGGVGGADGGGALYRSVRGVVRGFDGRFVGGKLQAAAYDFRTQLEQLKGKNCGRQAAASVQLLCANSRSFRWLADLNKSRPPESANRKQNGRASDHPFADLTVYLADLKPSRVGFSQGEPTLLANDDMDEVA